MPTCCAGSQLLNSYGPRSNDDLLLRYTMVAPDNPDDVYVVDNLLQRLCALQVCTLIWVSASQQGRSPAV